MCDEKKRVGIVTIDDYTNYGNRLQSYALTKLLENEGVQVYNGIQVSTRESWVKRTYSPLKKMLKLVYPYSAIKEKIAIKPQIIDGILGTRVEKFLSFINTYTTLIPPITAPKNSDAYKQLLKYNIDCYIAGSDQIWNPHYEGHEYEFLTFAPKEKRLTFAASIGAAEIPDNLKSIYKENISELKYISVREKRAAEIVYELTGRKADITLDPTLLLGKSEWESMVKPTSAIKEDEYICTYFLGEIPEAVEKFANGKKLKVYHLNSTEDKELFVLDPAEFLYVIMHSKYVLTDSFHAVAFSIKFNKEFYVFRRKQDGVANMFSRIETLLGRFDLENRAQERTLINELPPVDDLKWHTIENITAEERRSAMERLIKEME